jgi:hypothetical protein
VKISGVDCVRYEQCQLVACCFITCCFPHERGSFVKGLEGYERMVLETGFCLYWGSVGQPGVGLSTRDFEIWLKGSLVVGRLYGSSVKGPWREGSLAGDPGGLD